MRPLKAGMVDPFGWVVVEPARKVVPQPIEHNVDDLRTKPSFYEMVKQALLADKMQYLRGVSIHNIYKHVAANWPVELATYRRLTRAAIKRAIENEKIETAGNFGASYRLAPSERPSKTRRGKVVEEEEEAEVAPKASKASKGSKNSTKAKAAPSKKRKAADIEAPAPKKVAKRKEGGVKKNANLRTGDHTEKQSGEGKWVRFLPSPSSLWVGFGGRKALIRPKWARMGDCFKDLAPISQLPKMNLDGLPGAHKTTPRERS